MDKATAIIKQYEEAVSIKDHWREKFEEAYEYCLPNRESFYDESPGQRRTDKIFDETAVVGVQEFASRLQAGIVPTFASCLLYTSPSPRDRTRSRMPSSA